jgi:hypothetical protein
MRTLRRVLIITGGLVMAAALVSAILDRVGKAAVTRADQPR